jgi:HK97 family phage major capsid protein
MDTGTTTTGQRIAIYGDMKTAFRIVDRIGMAVELVPTLFGSNRRPSGQRGLFAYWRTGSGVVAKNALRYLEVK